ncbi:MAG: hypothetical protein Q8S54_14580 [Bacteroidota bacterium]|nr:hypothetical protein [Odoribacter sp.]MDP3644402.1 hypothetical protein [Bacteroidota bacterium]
MKKLTLYILTAFFMLSVIPTQLKAGTESNPAATTATSAIKSTEYNVAADRLAEINAIEMSTLNSSGTKELLKEASSVKNDQGRRGKGYEKRNKNRGTDVIIVSERRVRGDGYYEGRHRHSGTYIGAGGVLVLILILILIL